MKLCLERLIQNTISPFELILVDNGSKPKESIWEALRSPTVERVGHGTQAFEESLQMDDLNEALILLDISSLSNVCTAVVSSLALEYRFMVEQCVFRPDEVQNLILNGVMAS